MSFCTPRCLNASGSNKVPMKIAAVMILGCVANPMVTQQTIPTTICVPGWTDSIRPPSAYTNRLKARRLGLSVRNPVMRKYEEDHVCPLELGGHPRDPSNLRPQKWTGPWNARIKDRLENRLNDLVCSGKLDLATARHEIATGWVASYRRRIGMTKR